MMFGDKKKIEYDSSSVVQYVADYTLVRSVISGLFLIHKWRKRTQIEFLAASSAQNSWIYSQAYNFWGTVLSW